MLMVMDRLEHPEIQIDILNHRLFAWILSLPC